MQRDIKKRIEDGKRQISKNRDLKASEINFFHDFLESGGGGNYQSRLFCTLADMFYFGVSVGYRQAKKER